MNSTQVCFQAPCEISSDVAQCAQQMCVKFQLSAQETIQIVAQAIASEVSAMTPSAAMDTLAYKVKSPPMELIAKRILERISSTFFCSSANPSYAELFQVLMSLLSARQPFAYV